MSIRLNLAIAGSIAAVLTSMTSAYADTGFITSGKFFSILQVAESPGLQRQVDQSISQPDFLFDYNGNIVNFGQFIAYYIAHSNGQSGISVFDTYAQSHPVVPPAGIQTVDSNGNPNGPWTASEYVNSQSRAGSTNNSTNSSTNSGSPNTTSSNSSTGTSNPGAGSSRSTSGVAVTPSELPNAAANDSTYWQRASNDFYISARTNNPLSSAAPTESMVNVQPGQTLYLFGSSTNSSVNANMQWTVNSPDAAVAPANRDLHWSSTNPLTGQVQPLYEATFKASKPGIYTVQASSNNVYSVPLVITVGLSQLPRSGTPISGQTAGVQALPANLPAVSPQSASGITYYPYQSQNGWIPIAGTDSTAQSIAVFLTDRTTGQQWAYDLPVTNGSFSGMVRSPFQGNVTVELFPNPFQMLNQNNATLTPSFAYSVNVNTPALTERQKALLATMNQDYNLEPTQLVGIAEALYQNSPSVDTAIEAINNYVATRIVYNFPIFNDNSYVWQDAVSAWDTKLGVCHDYAILAASMLKTVGIPTETVPGTANNGVENDGSHEWIQAWDGTQWVTADPCWSAPVPSWTSTANEPVTSDLQNKYFTSTQAMEATHTATSGQTGGIWSPVLDK